MGQGPEQIARARRAAGLDAAGGDPPGDGGQVAEQAGAKSQVTGLVGAGVVVLLLLVFNSLLADLPQTALAAIVIAAALSLMDVGVLRR